MTKGVQHPSQEDCSMFLMKPGQGRFPREIFLTLPNVVCLRPNPSLLWYYLRHLCLLSFRVTPHWLTVVHTLLTCGKRGEMGGVRFYLNPGFLFFPGQVGEMSR